MSTVFTRAESCGTISSRFVSTCRRCSTGIRIGRRLRPNWQRLQSKRSKRSVSFEWQADQGRKGQGCRFGARARNAGHSNQSVDLCSNSFFFVNCRNAINSLNTSLDRREDRDLAPDLPKLSNLNRPKSSGMAQSGHRKRLLGAMVPASSGDRLRIDMKKFERSRALGK